MTKDDMNNTDGFTIGPLGIYENLKIEADKFLELPYSLQGQNISECAGVSYSGHFRLMEKTANSFFINSKEVSNFTDNNDKALDGFHIR